ncbi:hypothetical protein RKD55_003129 [Rossellomorea marisflavi]
MKWMKLFWMYVVVFGLFGWAMVEFFDMTTQMAAFNKNPDGDVMFEGNAFPFLLILIVCSILSILSYRSKKRRKLSLMVPDEFQESDEREKQITAEACKTAYMSMMIAAPVIAAMLVFYPLVAEKLPYYPVILFMLLPFVQVTAYLIHWKKAF